MRYRKFFVHLSGEHHLVDLKLHEKYGPVVRDGPNSLMFASLSAFDAIYGFHKFIEKGDFYDFGRDARSQAGSIFSARTDATHREHRRKLVGPALSTAKVAAYETIISKHVSVLVSRLQEEQDRSKDGSTIDVTSLVHRYAFDTLVETIFGEPISPLPYTETRGARNVLTGLKDIAKWAWGAALLPWFGWIMSTRPMVKLSRRPTFDEEGKLIGVAALGSRTRELVFTQPELTLKSNQPSILKNCFQVPETDHKHMAPDEIWRECFNLTFAGHGSTAAALTAVLFELGVHGHEWQDRIRSALRTEATSPASLPELLAVIKESLRLRAPFATAFPRSIGPGAETAISELPTPLPVGTMVYSNTYVLGHSKEIWGADVESWRPERWLGPENERKQPDDRFVVFSKGARGCIGKDIAMLMLTQAVANVLLKWNIHADGELKGKSFLEMQYTDCRIRFDQL